MISLKWATLLIMSTYEGWCFSHVTIEKCSQSNTELHESSSLVHYSNCLLQYVHADNAALRYIRNINAWYLWFWLKFKLFTCNLKFDILPT